MIITEYDEKYRQSSIDLLAILQNHERNISNDRPPSCEVSAKQLDYLLSACASDKGEIFLAVENSKAVGLIIIFQDHEHEGTPHVYPEFLQYGLISDFVVTEADRGTSVATTLMREAELSCKSLGLSTIKLSVLRANSVARKFYEKHGYVAHEVIYRINHLIRNYDYSSTNQKAVMDKLSKE